MKVEDFTLMFALTADQRDSRHHADRVPQALEALEARLGDRPVLPAERTAGDEIQLLVSQAQQVVDVVEVLTRLGGWRLGIGLGEVEQPLPASTREARGGAYIAARAAIDRAEASPTGTALEVATAGPAGSVTDVVYAGIQRQAEDAESGLWLLQDLWQRRSAEGWQMVDLLEGGLPVGQAARQLGISPSAASQRHQRASWALGVRARSLCVNLLTMLQSAATAGIAP